MLLDSSVRALFTASDRTLDKDNSVETVITRTLELTIFFTQTVLNVILMSRGGFVDIGI